MDLKTHTPQFLRKRKFFLVLPLLALPFITLLFWALGGGRLSEAQAQRQATGRGLNLELPDAYFKDDKSLNKLSYYEKAASDSAKLDELMRSDPYYLQRNRADPEAISQGNDSLLLLNKYKQGAPSGGSGLNTSPYRNNNELDPNEAKVYQKLEQLNTAMNQAVVQTDKEMPLGRLPRSSNPLNSTDINRLEGMMNMAQSVNTGKDAEMEQLNGMMDKILDIQHPERVKERLKKTPDTPTPNVLTVTSNINEGDNTSLLENEGTGLSRKDINSKMYPNSGFYSLEEDTEMSIDERNTIQAVIHETQTLTEGATVKLRLLHDISVNGTLVPKGIFVFGTASLNGDRLSILINSVRYKNTLFPVRLSVYDLDGMEGIHIPGAITRDVAKSSVDRTVQGLNLTTLNPSIGAQAASAGIEAAKTLLSRKARLVEVIVKAGYQVFLTRRQ